MQPLAKNMGKEYGQRNRHNGDKSQEGIYGKQINDNGNKHQDVSQKDKQS